MDHERRAFYGDTAKVHIVGLFGAALCGAGEGVKPLETTHTVNCAGCIRAAVASGIKHIQQVKAEQQSGKQFALALEFDGKPTQQAMF